MVDIENTPTSWARFNYCLLSFVVVVVVVVVNAVVVVLNG